MTDKVVRFSIMGNPRIQRDADFFYANKQGPKISTKKKKSKTRGATAREAGK